MTGHCVDYGFPVATTSLTHKKCAFVDTDFEAGYIA